jgi:tetratricopeptide (TPR) repeat protein
MIHQTLTIRYGGKTLREPTAWFVPGASAAVWLEELVRWGVAHGSLVLRVIPTSRQDLNPRGILVTAPSGVLPRVGPACLRYGRLASRLYLPVEAFLDPDVSEAELTALLSRDTEYVWHPATGLIGFERADLLRVADLLAGPAASGRAWDRARPGIGFARRLTSLLPTNPPTVESILGQGRDDIGSDSGSLGSLPRAPGEPSSGPLASAGRGALGAFAGLVGWLTRRAPGDPGREPGWVGRLRDWANRKLEGISDALTARRNREIARLMDLLERDPDQGLRYALPMGGSGAHRGVSTPGDRLTHRDVNFNLGRLGGGAAADFWDLPPDYHTRLVARYRELADREIRLGRHRRAAYIFAELLGDLPAAARTLMAGGHFREAAVLYRDRLNQPAEAARCLEQGGLWAEAIALYEELRAHEKAGDLYAKLDQHDNAREQYQQATVLHRAGGSFLEAARVLEQKLQEPDQALAELRGGWPASPHAGHCLRRFLALLGRLGRHEETRQRIEQFRKEPVPAQVEGSLVDILSETATSYPDRAVQATAADCTRVRAARQLPEAEPAEARQLVNAVNRLEPQDRLLGRDCQHYLQRQPRPTVQRPSRRKSPSLVGRVQLPRDIEWRAATGGGAEVYAAGVRDGEPVVFRCRPDGAVQEAAGPAWRVRALAGAPFLLSALPRDNPPEYPSDHLLAPPPVRTMMPRLGVLFHLLGSPQLLANRFFLAADAFRTIVNVGSSDGFSEASVGAVQSPTGITWLVEIRNNHWTLVGVGASGEPITTRVLAPLDVAGPGVSLPVPVHASREHVHIGLGNQLVVVTLGTGRREIIDVGLHMVASASSPPPPLENPDRTAHFEMEGVITSLRGSAPDTRERLAVTFPRGGLLLREHFYEQGLSERFASEMDNPVAGFTGTGDLVAASATGCEVYSTAERHLHLKGELSGTFARPLAVLPLPRTDCFGLFTEEGELAVYQVPAA